MTARHLLQGILDDPHPPSVIHSAVWRKVRWLVPVDVRQVDVGTVVTATLQEVARLQEQGEREHAVSGDAVVSVADGLGTRG